jgi:hypothetical protein
MTDSSTTLANTLLRRALGSAAVESFGIAHQIPYLEFRDERAEDHVLSIDTAVSSNVMFIEALELTEQEKLLLLFNRVNLRSVAHVACDEHANLVLEFDNGVHLRFAGNPPEVSEPWQVGSRADFETGGYLIIATHGGSYAIWDYTPTLQN